MSDNHLTGTPDKTGPDAKSEKSARPVRREPKIQKAPVVLDERGAALSEILLTILKDFEIEYSAAVDEVVALVNPADLAEVCQLVKKDKRSFFNYLRSISVVDYEQRLEINYHLFSLKYRHKMVFKTSVSPDNPRVPTVTGVWRSANWYEREGHDLFGVVFEDHPDMRPLLLYDGFEGYPGRKNFPFHDYDEW